MLSVAVPTMSATPAEGPPTHTYQYILSGPPTHTYQYAMPGPSAEEPPTHTQYWLQAQLSEDCKATIRYTSVYTKLYSKF